jgi:hypothetical protein
VKLGSAGQTITYKATATSRAGLAATAAVTVYSSL